MSTREKHMDHLSLAEIQSVLNQADMSGLPALSISVLRNITVEPMEPFLRYLALELGLAASIKLGGFDTVYQDAVGGNNDLLSQATDCVLVFLRLEGLSPELARNFAAMSADDIAAEEARIEAHVKAVVQGIRAQSKAMILWHGFEPPINPALGIYDAQTGQGQSAVVARLNDSLRRIMADTPSAYLVDMASCMLRLGADGFYDQRLWHIGRIPYTRQAMREIALQDFKFIRPLLGKNKKCLVLDCDNTLWGGIIGEDGLGGIGLGQSHPGSAYLDLQQEVVNLFHRGVIIALCSKNNPDDVWQVFGQHPDMVLKKEHIAAWRINWQDKAGNLRELAQELNIGLDALVFVDDSEFEVGAVRQLLPEVTVIHLAKENAVNHANTLAACGLFDTLTLSDEDRKRGQMYKAQVERADLMARSPDMAEYLESLEMTAQVRLADAISIPRLAQQTQKTNQFNLTTRRYSEADIQSLAESEDSDVISLRLSDRFGDSGIVGTCILRYDQGRAVFDTLLMSCRALGRGVEEVLLHQALSLAKQKRCTLAVGEYYATPKNTQVADFFARQGFVDQEHASSSQADRVFHLDLGGELPRPGVRFKSIDSQIG